MKTKGGVFFMVVVFLNVSSLKSQSNDAKAAFYNISFGAVFSTVGAILNKNPHDDSGKMAPKHRFQSLGIYHKRQFFGTLQIHARGICLCRRCFGKASI
jgi:hypothetical protein